jgi:hypothetical protein
LTAATRFGAKALRKHVNFTLGVHPANWEIPHIPKRLNLLIAGCDLTLS